MDKRALTFPNGICSKVNVLARLEFEIACCDVSVHHFNYCCIAFTRPFYVLCSPNGQLSSPLFTSVRSSLFLFNGRFRLALFLFVDEEWHHDQKFLCTYYLYLWTAFPFIPRYGLNGESVRASRTVLVTWLKPSNENRGLKLTSSSTPIHHTGWYDYIFSLMT